MNILSLSEHEEVFHEANESFQYQYPVSEVLFINNTGEVEVQPITHT